MKSKKPHKIRNAKIPVDELYFQYVPSTFRREFFPGPEESMLRLDNSPHYEFCMLYREIGDQIWKQYKETDYIKLMIAWGRDDKHNRWKVRRFLDTFSSIQKNGIRNRIIVLEKPMYKKFFKRGYEIFHGHHRASSLAALGHSFIPCTISKFN